MPENPALVRPNIPCLRLLGLSKQRFGIQQGYRGHNDVNMQTCISTMLRRALLPRACIGRAIGRCACSTVY